jgi:hypothetical protein
MDDEEAGVPSNDDRESLARLLGLGQVALGVGVLLFALVLPARLANFVSECNTVGGYLYGQSRPSNGFQCAVANFVVDYKWIGVILAVGLMLEGTAMAFHRELKRFYENLDAE